MSEIMSNKKIKGHKVWSYISADGGISSDSSSIDHGEPFAWEEPTVDLSDFVPLAELVRSFQPQDKSITPEFEYPDGQAPDGYDPPSEYDDITDVYEAVQAKKEALTEEVKKRKQKDAENKASETVAPSTPKLDNKDNIEQKLEQVKEKASE